MGAVARAPDPAVLAECVETWFGGMRVNTLPPIASTGHLTQRIGMEGQVQLLTGDIHDQLKKLKPKDAFCIVGYIMIDLYPRKEWNFVFGQARSDIGTGIFSFARYAHCESSAHFLRRCCSVLVHEIGHLFGLAHCVWYECNMNGSNHDEESDKRPLHLCPVELHKLYHSLGGKLDLHLRDQRLAEFFEGVGLLDDAKWYRARVAFVSSLAALPQEKARVVKKKAVAVVKKPKKCPAAPKKQQLGREMLKLTNEFRKSEGLGALDWHVGMLTPANEHSRNMGDGKVKFGHGGFQQRCEAFTFAHSGAGENVAMVPNGHRDVAKVTVDGWINSPGHRENLLGDWTYCTIGVYQNAKGAWYSTQLFAKT